MTEKDYELHLWILDHVVTDKPLSYLARLRVWVAAGLDFKRLDR